MGWEPIAHIGIALGPKVGGNDVLVRVRVVPNGKAGNEVYGRTLNVGEVDKGDRILLSVGEEVVFPVGSVRLAIDDVDKYAVAGLGGYSPIANTIWTWLQIPPLPSEQRFHYLFSVARRLDSAHSLWVGAMQELTGPNDEPFIQMRARLFTALGYAESMCIALNRVIVMIRCLPSKFGVTTPVPTAIDSIWEATEAIRNAFEHIGERAFGKARKENAQDAMTIFDQSDFVASGKLSYAGHTLDLKAGLIPVLVAARKYILDIAAEAGTKKTDNEEIRFGPMTSD